MKQKNLELAVGLFVALGLAAFLMLALKVSDLTSFGDDEGYRVTAKFENIGGLKTQAPVTLSGVRIGRVVHIGLDPQSYEAVVTLLINPKYNQLPDDSGASILTAGLLGEQCRFRSWRYGHLSQGWRDHQTDPVSAGIGKVDRPVVCQHCFGWFLSG